jgi:hypothetical protein
MLRIRNERVPGLLVRQLLYYVVDIDLDGTIDIGSTTKLNGEPQPGRRGEPVSSRERPMRAPQLVTGRQIAQRQA